MRVVTISKTQYIEMTAEESELRKLRAQVQWLQDAVLAMTLNTKTNEITATGMDGENGRSAANVVKTGKRTIQNANALFVRNSAMPVLFAEGIQQIGSEGCG